MIGAFALTGENRTHLSFAFTRPRAWSEFNPKVCRKKDGVALNGFSYRVKALTFKHWVVSGLKFVKNMLAKLSAVFVAEAVMRSLKAVTLRYVIKKSKVSHLEISAITKRLRSKELIRQNATNQYMHVRIGLI